MNLEWMLGPEGEEEKAVQEKDDTEAEGEITEAPADKSVEGDKSDKIDIQDLIEKAKKKGSLTNSEIMVALGDTDYDIDQIDKLYEALDSMGIDVTECFDDDDMAENIEDDIESDLENFDKPENMEKILAQEGLTIDDPVKLYLKEIGRVPLLDADREAELAKKNVRGG